MPARDLRPPLTARAAFVAGVCVGLAIAWALVVLTGCGGGSYRCACTADGKVRAVEMANHGPWPFLAPLPAKTGSDLCVAVCQANEVLAP